MTSASSRRQFIRLPDWVTGLSILARDSSQAEAVTACLAVAPPAAAVVLPSDASRGTVLSKASPFLGLADFSWS